MGGILMRTFWFHFNKPATLRAGKAQISVHHEKVCHIVDNVICKRPTEGKIKPKNPKFVMKGKCHKLTIVNGIAYIE